MGLCWFVIEQIMDFPEMLGLEMSLSRNSHNTLQQEWSSWNGPWLFWAFAWQRTWSADSDIVVQTVLLVKFGKCAICGMYGILSLHLLWVISVVEKTGSFSCFHCGVMREDTFSLLAFAGHLGHLEMCIVNFNVPLKWWGMLNLGERGRGRELDSIWNLSWMDCSMENKGVPWMSKIHFPSELLSF